MPQEVNLNNKTVFSKRDYLKTIDTSFKELGIQQIQEEIDNTPSVQEFFNTYEEIFYQIPELGDKNSHEYLIKSSAEYINFNENDELIEALQQEISELREELLETQKQIGQVNT
jgi:hypothetical protein